MELGVRKKTYSCVYDRMVGTRKKVKKKKKKEQEKKAKKLRMQMLKGQSHWRELRKKRPPLGEGETIGGWKKKSQPRGTWEDT